MCCCMCSLVEILCLLEEKFGLVCLQLPMICMLRKFLVFNPLVNFLYFFLKMSELVWYFYYL